jgi:hypothetical protein
MLQLAQLSPEECMDLGALLIDSNFLFIYRQGNVK